MHRRLPKTVLSLTFLVSNVGHAGDIEPLKSAPLSMGAGCNIRMQVPVRAKVEGSREEGGTGTVSIHDVPPPGKHRKAALDIRLRCYDERDEMVGYGPVRFDVPTNRWVKDVDKYLPLAFGSGASAQLRKELDKAVRVYPISSAAAPGYAYTENELTWQAQHPKRTLTFCLPHPPKAVCGDTKVGYVAEGAKSDLTAYALRIIESIEFVE